MSETSSKKRLAITITSLCVAVVSVICSVVAIFAASRQGVQSTFRVTYKATNVAANVSAEYTVLNQQSVSLGSIKIEAGEAETTYDELSTDKEIELSAANNEVTFKYTFENLSSNTKIKITLADGANKNNVTVSYAYAAAGATDELTYTSSLGEVEVPTNGTVNVYIRVKITKTADDAHYIADETNQLVWSLDAVRVDPAPQG